MDDIKKIAVIGPGTMGMGIAFTGAFAGLDVFLLGRRREKYTGDNSDLENEPIFQGEMRGLDFHEIENNLSIGKWPDDMDLIKDCDLIIEAIAEDEDLKIDILSTLMHNTDDNTIIGTNTSNISIHSLAKGFTDKEKNRFMGTHFFNPVRYMKLVEIVLHDDSKPENVKKVEKLITNIYEKNPIIVKDTPGFVANRVGDFSMLSGLFAAEEYDLDIVTSDILGGEIVFRPRSGLYRLMDIIGADLEYDCCQYFLSVDIPDWEKPFHEVPPRMQEMYSTGKFGNKSGQGFYRKLKVDGNKKIQSWDFDKQEYLDVEEKEIACLTETADIKDRIERLKTIMQREDNESRYVRKLILETFWSCALFKIELSCTKEVIDIAMRDGYNWELGPFELWDKMGQEFILDLMAEDGYRFIKAINSSVEEN